MFQQATHYCGECGQPVEVPDKMVEWHGITLSGRRLSYLDRSTRITHRLATILSKLMTRQACSVEGLLMALETEAIAGDNMIRVYITRLRAKLAEVGAPVQIVTEWGLGYRLEHLSLPARRAITAS